MSDLSNRVANQRFEEAHRRALIASILDTIRRQPTDMLSFEEVRTRLNVRGQRYLGSQTVRIDHIIGSEGRYGDFDRRFLPRNRTLKQRWANVSRAISSDTTLPPVELYKIDDVYFVRDGNHRVSAARDQGQEYIDAIVTELQVDVPLEPDTSVRDLLFKEEYSDFLEWTNLHELRPEQRIEFSEPGGYLDLIRHINAHRYYMGIDLARPIERDEAIADWYDNVYMPLIHAIREGHLLEHFPGRTEADLYRWIMDHRWYMRERSGIDPGPHAAARDYVDRFGKGEIDRFLSHLLSLIGLRQP
jgi:hypothetical protein